MLLEVAPVAPLISIGQVPPEYGRSGGGSVSRATASGEPASSDASGAGKASGAALASAWASSADGAASSAAASSTMTASGDEASGAETWTNRSEPQAQKNSD